MWYLARMKRAAIACLLALGGLAAAAMAVAGPNKGGAAAVPADPPTVPSLGGLMEKELHWGMSHTDVTTVYNQLNGLFDREYAPQLAKLQPGVQQQQLEADRDNRKTNFERSYTEFNPGSPTGYDVTALHLEYTYGNSEAVNKLFKDAKNRYFFYIKDRFWKMYDEIPLRADGALGSTFQEAVSKLNLLFNVAGRIRAADATNGPERTEADWQDARSHLRAVDRSGEHLVGLVLEDRNTLQNLPSLRTYKPVDPFALDPSIANVTKNGVSDPNAARNKPGDAGAGKGKGPGH
jgi:hypothetical protein